MEKNKEYINEKVNQFKDFMSDLGKTHKEGDPLRLTKNKENFQYMYAIKPDNVVFLIHFFSSFFEPSLVQIANYLEI